jgi:hypothetical protein
VIATIRNPSKADPADPGEVATGTYTVTEDTLTLVTLNGEPVTGKHRTRRLRPGEDQAQVARRLIKDIRGKRMTDFNRRLILPRWGIV